MGDELMIRGCGGLSAQVQSAAVVSISKQTAAAVLIHNF